MTLTKTLIIGSALALLLGLLSSTAMAKDVDLGKHTEDEIKGICKGAGGKFVTDGQTYGCSKACKGGTCAVICDKDDGCFGTTFRRFRPLGWRMEYGSPYSTVHTGCASHAQTRKSDHPNGCAHDTGRGAAAHPLLK